MKFPCDDLKRNEYEQGGQKNVRAVQIPQIPGHRNSVAAGLAERRGCNLDYPETERDLGYFARDGVAAHGAWRLRRRGSVTFIRGCPERNDIGLRRQCGRCLLEGLIDLRHMLFQQLHAWFWNLIHAAVALASRHRENLFQLMARVGPQRLSQVFPGQAVTLPITV